MELSFGCSGLSMAGILMLQPLLSRFLLFENSLETKIRSVNDKGTMYIIVRLANGKIKKDKII